MCALLALPQSSACVERVFTQVNIIKTKTTNSLNPMTVTNRLLAKQAISRQKVENYSWQLGLSASLVSDVAEAKCYRRYLENDKNRQQERSITLHKLDDVDDPFE